MAITENKNKVSSLAKDFGMQSKDIIAILKDYTEAPKGHSQVLSDRELSIVFDYLTLHHQVKIETIFAETYTEKKEEPKAAPTGRERTQGRARSGGERTAGRREDGGSAGSRTQGGSRRGAGRAGQVHRHAAADHPRAGKEDRGYPQVHQRQPRQV